MTTMKWKLRWTMLGDGELVPGDECGLRSLQECRSRLFDIRRGAEDGGFALVDAQAMPELTCGTVRLLGPATMMRGVARCGVL